MAGPHVVIHDRSREAAKEIREISQGDIRSFAENMAELAADYSPYLTGNNAGSIAFAERGHPNCGDHDFVVYTESGYGGYLEIGTANRTAYRYILRAFEDTKREFERGNTATRRRVG